MPMSPLFTLSRYFIGSGPTGSGSDISAPAPPSVQCHPLIQETRARSLLTEDAASSAAWPPPMTSSDDRGPGQIKISKFQAVQS